MNSNPHDRYAEQPPQHWVGHLWVSTWKDKGGMYVRGQILDVAPGRLLVRWLGYRRRADEWVSTDSGTFSRSVVKDFLDGPPLTGR